jgi:hypothetical protein
MTIASTGSDGPDRKQFGESAGTQQIIKPSQTYEWPAHHGLANLPAALPDSAMHPLTETASTWSHVRQLARLTVIASLLMTITAPAAGPADKLWSIQPLERPAVPAHAAGGHPIDHFIRARLEEQGLKPSPSADRRTLIRRLYFDLIGLPPAPDEIESFVNDPNPHAYEALVDRLLASPRYGERWARHWLDVVHFGETHGYDKDKPRMNAWPYRDYVIRSFNEDKLWSRFIEEQVAGDVLYPFTRDGIEALGFIAAGPWDFIGHAEVPESKIDGKIARHLDRDDMVANTMQSFNSLTVQCAQCHDHMSDPISQADYYALQAVFAAVDRTDKDYDLEPEIAKMRWALNQRRDPLVVEQKRLNERIRARAGESLTALNEAISKAAKSVKQSEAFGYHSAIELSQDTVKWVQLDLGRSVKLKQIVLHPAKDDFNGIGEGFGFPVRFKVEVAANGEFTQEVRMIADQNAADVANPGIKPQAFEAVDVVARFIRVTATKLAPRQNDFIFALAELRLLDEAGSNVASGAAVTALDSIEAPARWRQSNLTDGWYPGLATPDSAEIAKIKSARDELLERCTLDDERGRLTELDEALNQVNEELAQLPPVQRAYVAAVHTGSGTFTGTGANGGRPRPIHLLKRGSVLTPAEEVRPGTLGVVPELPSRFELPDGHAEGERRAALAKWLADSRNPLTWRSIVNRVWQQHFGRGLVETPNDFGHMGAQPSHPELLDWLACEFRDGGQSLKQLHRLIVTSGTYRQSSVISETVNGDQSESAPRLGADALITDSPITDYSASAAAIDADNRLLWRMNRRKLEAEAVRDAMLFVAGRLDPAMGGPSFQDFVIDKPEHSPHYLYDQHDPDDAQAQRRTIYRFLVRSQPQPFMAALDCADPSIQVATRNESVTALQSLALLNNALVISLSKHFATRLESETGPISEKTTRAFYLAIGRPPTDGEATQLSHFAEEHGLENLCRALFNLNEFAFVD